MILPACATVFLELLASLALVNGYARAVVVPGLFLMMCGFWFVMGISFPQWLAVFVFCIPWEGMFPSDGKEEPRSLRPAPTGS